MQRRRWDYIYWEPSRENKQRVIKFAIEAENWDGDGARPMEVLISAGNESNNNVGNGVMIFRNSAVQRRRPKLGVCENMYSYFVMNFADFLLWYPLWQSK